MKNLNLKYAVLFVLTVILLPLGTANAAPPPPKKPIYQVKPNFKFIPRGNIEFREGRMRAKQALGTTLFFGGSFYLTGSSAFIRRVRTNPIIMKWYIMDTRGRGYMNGTVRVLQRRTPLLVKFKPTRYGRYYLNVLIDTASARRAVFTRPLPTQYVSIIRVPILPRATIASAYLSAYVVPFSSWCRNHSAGDRFEGRIHTTINFPRTGGPTGVPANLVTRTGLGDIRSPVSLGRGRLSVSTSTLNFTHAEVCSDNCAQVWLEARGSAGYRFDSTRVNACVR